MKKILYFTAVWCQPCKQLSPTMSKLMGNGMNVQKIDVDNDTQYSSKYGVRSVPTLLLVDGNGNALGRLTGNKSEQEILNLYNG
jgi:thioredoxin 1